MAKVYAIEIDKVRSFETWLQRADWVARRPDERRNLTSSQAKRIRRLRATRSSNLPKDFLAAFLAAKMKAAK